MIEKAERPSIGEIEARETPPAEGIAGKMSYLSPNLDPLGDLAEITSYDVSVIVP